MVVCEEMGYGSYISQDTDLAENIFYLIYITSDNVRHYRMKSRVDELEKNIKPKII